MESHEESEVSRFSPFHPRVGTPTSPETVRGASAPLSSEKGFASRAAVRLRQAAKESQSAGAARLPVARIRNVAMAGVNPPKTTVFRLNDSEKAAVRIFLGIISTRNGIIAPL